MPKKSELTLTKEGSERLGRAIMVRRAVLRLDRKELANLSGRSYPYIHQIETGIRTPSVDTLNRVASVMDMSSESLLELADSLPTLDDATRAVKKA